MAKTPEAVRGLLERVWKPARARALADRDAMQALIAEEGGNFAFAAVGLALLRREAAPASAPISTTPPSSPTSSLDHMIDAAFDCATRLFGVTFTERKDIPVWHPDVRVWEVKDADGRTRRCSTATTLPGPRSAPAPG